MNILPINLDDLIHSRSVENVRREFKKTWNPPILDTTIRSICAFANDFFNLNGGYIVIGIEENEGLPVLPPHGLDGLNLDEIQKEIRGRCKRIDPEYQPVLSPEIYQGKQILVIWCPGGDVRPYQAPHGKSGERNYYVRQGSESVEAKGEILTQLIQMTAKVPFDDRRYLSATSDVISPTLVRNFLSDIKSDLVALGTAIPDPDLYRNLRIVVRVNGYEAPKNVALLFFVNDPEEFIPGARIEIVQFGDDAGGDLIEEKVFRGPIHTQLRQALDYLNSFSTTMVRKVPGRAEAHRNVAFPYEAMEEALVNAVYHRSYEGPPEPIKVYLYPDRMEIISYPGPVPGVELSQFRPGNLVPPVPSRNRRIGEFLKELRLAEGRGTGVPKIRRKMMENGSPAPEFSFDESRTYFRVTLPAHPQYIVIHSLRESAQLWAIGERQQAIHNLEAALRRVPDSGALVAQIIDYLVAQEEIQEANRIFAASEAHKPLMDRHLPFISLARAYLDHGEARLAADLLARAPAPQQGDEVIELAILNKRAERYEQAHEVFVRNYDLIKDNAKAVQEFAQTKMELASAAYKRRRRQDRGEQHIVASKRLNQEASELLRRAIQIANDPVREGWCWYDLAKVLRRLRRPNAEIEQSYLRAMDILPGETRFRNSYEEWRQPNDSHGR